MLRTMQAVLITSMKLNTNSLLRRHSALAYDMPGLDSELKTGLRSAFESSSLFPGVRLRKPRTKRK